MEHKLLEAIKGVDDKVDDKDETKSFKGKWVSILGDSISTYEGWIPSDNATFYPKQDVTDVTKTWWHQLLTRLGAKLCVNQSWSGRRVSDEKSVNSAVRNAVNKLHRETGKSYINLDDTTEVATKRQDPDIILIMLGINDFNNDVPLGELCCNNSPSYDSTNFSKSYETMLMDIIGRNYPLAKVYCLNIAYSSSHCEFLMPNNASNKLIEYRKAIEEAAKEYECNVIHLDRIGITAANIEQFTEDKLHPGLKFMIMIANQCYNEMMASNCL